MRYSVQREEILKYLKSTCSHPTAEMVYENVSKIIPKISLGTVYRNLNLLSSNGDIVKIDSDNDRTNYDGCTDDHQHFICTNCGKIYDINLEKHGIECKHYGFTVAKESIILYGECNQCGKI